MVVLRVLTFNVNGIRSLRDYYRKTQNLSFSQFLDTLQADIICFQETKANKPELLDHEMSFPEGYHAYYSFPRRPKKIGYSGVVTFVKDSAGFPAVAYSDAFIMGQTAFHQEEEEDLEWLDSEGRVMMTDHGAFTLLNVYFPNYGGQERADFRNKFYTVFFKTCDTLVKQQGKALLIATDLNTVWHPIDHCDYVKPLMEEFIEPLGADQTESLIEKTAQWINSLLPPYPPSLQIIDDWLAENARPNLDLPSLFQTFFREKGSRLWAYNLFQPRETEAARYLDCFRHLHPGEAKRFTCWNTLIGARGANYGTRLDYIIATGPDVAKIAAELLKGSGQMYDVMGSDHCPVWADFDFTREPSDQLAPVKSTNIRKQQRLDSFFKFKQTVRQDNNRSEDTLNSRSMATEAKGNACGTIQSTLTKRPRMNEALPVCDKHREPCTEWAVKKAGPNRGKKFYLCSRPVGHPTDPQARCNHFEWKR